MSNNTVDNVKAERQSQGRRFIEALLVSHRKLSNNTYNVNKYEAMLNDPSADLYNEALMIRSLYSNSK